MLFLNRRTTCPLLLAALLLPATAQAVTPRYAGVTWTDPAGMKLSDSDHDCPSRCVVYEGKDDQYPLLRVHEAVIGSAPQTLKTLLAWMKSSQGETVKVIENAFTEAVVKDGAVTAYFYLLDRGDSPDDGSPDSSLFLLLEQGGVTVPIEQYGLSRGQLGDNTKTVLGLVNSVKLNPAAIKKDLTARTAAFTQAAQALKNGYARGEKVKLYTWSESGVRNVYTPSGMQLQAFNNTGSLAFLPGGLFLEDARDDLRGPDWRAVGDGELPARWKSVGGGYQVTLPNGKTTLYKIEKVAQARIRQGNRTYTEIPALSAKDVIGTFSTKYASTSGMGDTAVNSSGNLDVKLLPNGRYEDRSDSYTSVISSNVTAGSGGKKATGGKWAYDPASYTLTLSPDGGGKQSGLTYTEVFTPAARQIKGEGSVDWLFMGRTGWWKSK
ncbi:hypothetical protein [Deinococcus marmoris]|uniref:Uncharacterized protein n=1 Tax=Deinococcus marmoris TaxID=249408 RepID=A0A1U7P562_9DEIO|nr:hypothetical protein [Deinococcus marmoris]OLV20290.1 hypothetical protein BOO71_0000334 [Deinococcus marmoris]